jgi:hypothetical protein
MNTEETMKGSAGAHGNVGNNASHGVTQVNMATSATMQATELLSSALSVFIRVPKV